MTLALFPTRGFRRTREKASSYLLAFSADDASLELPTGQTLTYARSGTRTVFDSQGKVVTLSRDQLPWSAHYNATTGNREPVYQSDRGITNLVVRSEDYGNTWAAVGSPTRTAAAKTCGDVGLDLIGDDSAGALEGYTQTVGFTADAVKAVSVFISKGTSSSSVIRLRDTSAPANRLLATITWSGTAPSVAMTTGTHIASVVCADGVYRLLFQTTSVTAANTNSLEIYPATDNALAVSSTGTVYVGGAQAENYDYPRQYMKSVGSSGSTTGDELYATVAWLPRDFTVYARLARPSWAGATTPSGFIGGIVSQWNASGGRWRLQYEGVSGTITAYLNDGSTSVTATAAIPSTGFYDLCVQYTDVLTAGKVRVDVGAGFGSYSSTVTAISAWASSTLYLGQAQSGTENLDAGIRKLIVAPGAHTLSALRGILD